MKIRANRTGSKLNAALFVVIIGVVILGVHFVGSAMPTRYWLSDASEQPEMSTKSSSYEDYRALRCSSNGSVVNATVAAGNNFCVTKGKNFDAASYLPAGSGQTRFAVRIGADKNFYKLNFNSSDGAVSLIPGTDTLTQKIHVSGSVYKLRIYKNAIRYLAKSLIAPEYTLSLNGLIADTPLAEDSAPITVDSYANSRDGRYFVLNNKDGVIFYDSQENVKKYIYVNQLQGYNNRKVAVSDDGKYVAITDGYDDGATAKIYYQVGCGDSVTTNTLSASYDMSNPCTYYDLSSYFWDEDLSQLISVAFNEDGGRVSFESYAGEGEFINTRTFSSPGHQVASAPGINYLALGDSISSGEGDTGGVWGRKYYREHTDERGDTLMQPREKCHVSTRSYPYLLAQDMQLRLSTSESSLNGWNSVACSGAETTDIYSDGYGFLYQGQAQGGIYNKEMPRLQGYINREALQTAALNEMIPGRIEQIKFVEKYKPRVITLTVGANDIDFGGKLQSCVRGVSTCDWASSKKSLLAGDIQAQYEKLRDLYKDLYKASGNTAKIYVLGYPQLISKAEPAGCSWNIGSLDKEEREMIYDATAYLNLVIERAANAAGVKYVDISDALNGGRLCDSGQEFMTGLTFSSANGFQESFHPNSKGHKKIAAKVQEEVDGQSLIDYPVCDDGYKVFCPKVGGDAEKPAVPIELGGVASSSRSERITDPIVTKNSLVKYLIGLYTLQPNSTFEVAYHSNPTSLGQFMVGAEGDAELDLIVPSSLPAGYHTLVVNGVTYSGEPIELTQTVLVQGADSGDVDEDGVLDSQQPCGPFIAASGLDEDLDGIDDACDPHIADSPDLYRVRAGESGRMYGAEAEHEDYLYIERNTRASTITGVAGDYDPDGDGWAIVAASQGVPYDTTHILDTGPAANFIVTGDGATAKPYVYIRAGGYGCVGYTPTSLAKVEEGQYRTLKRVALNTDKCRAEDPSDDLDFNGLSDNEQPLYMARNGDAAEGEDPSRIYLLRSFHAAETQLGISDYTPTGTSAGNASQPIQEWNLLASSKPNQYIPTFNKLIILQENNTPLPIILTKKQNGQCIAYQPSTTSIIKKTTQTTRYITKLATVPEGEDCE